MLTGTLTASAYDFAVDGIYYNKNYNYNGINAVDVTFASTNNGYPAGGDYSGDVVIPESVEYNGVTYTVIGIRHSTFYNCTALTSIELPNTIRGIGTNYNLDFRGAFYGCVALTSIVIPNSVDYIGYCAFYNYSFFLFLPFSGIISSMVFQGSVEKA